MWKMNCAELEALPRDPAVDRVRVIVGRGNHSSAGEAMLPRAIEGHLVRCNRKFLARKGAVEVFLNTRGNASTHRQRSFALQSC